MRSRTAAVQDAGQLVLTFGAPTVVANGRGGFLVTPGRTLIELTPFQFARAVGCSRSSVYRGIDCGAIQGIRRPTPRKILIAAEEVERFRAWSADPECWAALKKSSV